MKKNKKSFWWATPLSEKSKAAQSKDKVVFVDTNSTAPFAMFEHYISETTAKWQNTGTMPLMYSEFLTTKPRPLPFDDWERRVQFVIEDDHETSK